MLKLFGLYRRDATIDFCVAVERDGELHSLEISGGVNAPVPIQHTTNQLQQGEQVYLMLSSSRKLKNATVEIKTLEGTLRQTVSLPCYTISFCAVEGTTIIRIFGHKIKTKEITFRVESVEMKQLPKVI